jgi:cell division protein FtsW
LIGFGLLISGQTFINLGVNAGLLPTKGLTLPFVSYGGSSLLVCCAMIGMMLRFGHELNQFELTNRRPIYES